VKLVASLLTTVLALYLLWDPGSIAWPAVLSYGLAVTLLELKAVALPGLGWISLSPAFVLGAALTPTVGPTGALGLMLGGYLVRCAWAPRLEIVNGLLMEALPLSTALAFIKLLAPQESDQLMGQAVAGLVGALAWGILITLLPPQLSGQLQHPEKWVVARSDTWTFQISAGLWALPIALLASSETGLELALLWPALVAQGLAQRAVQNPSAGEYQQARSRLHEVQKASQRLSATLQETEQQLEASAAGLDLVRAFTERLSENDSLEGLWKALNEEVRGQIPLRSTALYLPRKGRPVIAFADSPDWNPTGASHHQTDPVVERCWVFGRALFTRKAPPGERMFRGDEASAAVGFGPGVLYLGKGTPEPFNAAQKALLELIAGHAGNLVAAMLRRDQERQALTTSQQALGELTEWSGRLSALLNGARMLAGTLEPEALMRQLEDVMNGLFGSHAGCFFRLTPKGLEYYHGWPAGRPRPEAAQPLAQRILESGEPLEIDDLVVHRVAPFAEGQRALLGVPVESQYGVAGVLLLGSPNPPQRDDPELLYLVGLMLAVAYRSADVHQQLKASQEQLVQAGKLAAVGQLAAGVAHELNTPLGTVLLALEGAERALSKRPQRVPERLQRARRAVEHAQRITSTLLVFSRHEAGDYQPLQLEQLAAATLESLRASPGFAGVSLELQLQPAGPVRGSSAELEQLLTQLAKNGVEAAAEGRPPALRVFTRVAENEAILSVEDNGTGISSEVAARMFEPFFTTKAVGHGTGLGLSTCREVAVRHGGRLDFEPLPEGGSRFVLRLPLEQPA
jgi:signal transduction histidine kinase